LKELNVFLNHTKKLKVGKLVYSNRRIFFEYDKDFLASSLEISPYKLPLKEGVFERQDRIFDGLWGVFADSLPDGWGRLLINRHLRKIGIDPHSLNPLDSLSYVGKYGMGALSYEPCEEIEVSSLDNIMLDDLAKSSKNILNGSSDEMVEELIKLGGSSSGARPKALIQLDENLKSIIYGSQKLQKGYLHWMVKFASSLDSKNIGAIEYAYSLMAKDAGLDMPKTTLLKGKRGSYFACERFDRIKDKRVHLHSVAGLVHSDFRLPSLDYDDLLSLCLHLTKSVKEQEKVFKLACFNLIAHNCDDHAKNFSFLMDEDGKWTFSPVYDITFSHGPNGEHSTTFFGEGKKPTKEHLIMLAQRHKIKGATNIIDRVKNSIKNWKKYADIATVPKKESLMIDRILRDL